MRRHGIPQTSKGGLLPLVGMLLAVAPCRAVDRLSLRLDTAQGFGLQAHQVEVELAAADHGRFDLRLRAARLDLPPPYPAATGIDLSCPAAELTATGARCAAGTLRLQADGWAPGAIAVAFDYDASSTAELHLREVSLGGGRLRLDLAQGAGGWRADVDARGIDLAALGDLAPVAKLRGAASAGGHATITAHVQGAGAEVHRARLEADLSQLAFSSPSGEQAGEALGIRLALSAARQGPDWQLDTRLQGQGGTVCLGPCWELGPTPLQVRAQGHWRGAGHRLELSDVEVSQQGTLRAAGRVTLAPGDTPALQALALDFDTPRLAELYRRWLQPVLIGSLLDALDTGGAVHARIDYAPAGPKRLEAKLVGVTVEDKGGRFGLSDADGEITWGSDTAPRESWLQFAGAHLYRLLLGTARVSVGTQGNDVRLLQPVELPVLDGVLRIDRLRVLAPGTPKMQWSFEGLLTPISMQAFTHALDWPVMDGKLSGVIPEVSYDAGVLRVGGVLLIRAFDGAITLRDVRAERLFGLLPSLYADIDVQNIDLAALTRTFSFGNIQGRLSGAVQNLQMQDWQPVSFDARFATPPGDDSRHRISQTAVNNLTSLGGGGVSGALSRSLLRFFDEFSYDRLGISCRLSGGVCEMDGVASAPDGGYYIVKGGGLPRINVIGYTHRVAWPVLVQRLRSITASGAPVVR